MGTYQGYQVETGSFLNGKFFLDGGPCCCQITACIVTDVGLKYPASKQGSKEAAADHKQAVHLSSNRAQALKPPPPVNCLETGCGL